MALLRNTSTLKKRRLEATIVLAYLAVFLCGLYLGMLISDGWTNSADVTNAFSQPGKLGTRNRILMSADTQGKNLRAKPHILPEGPIFLPAKESTAKSAKAVQGVLSTQVALQKAKLATKKGILYDNLPYSKPEVRTTKLPRIYQTSKSIAGCLFIMDDTIRLLEWLAYHYTVLPLSHLMVAIDPNSKQTDRIMEILDSWKGKINIKAYRNDTEWLDLPWDYGYSRSIRHPNGELMTWYREKSSEIYFGQVHKRRQNYFCVHCMRHMKQQGMDWTIITDSDEYLMFNYKHKQQEDPTVYDAIKRGVSKEDIDKDRKKMARYREKLPPLEARATIADFIHQEKLKTKCIMFPGLQFTSYESKIDDVFRDVPSGINPFHLVTLRHRKAGLREGAFSKSMVDVSQGMIEDYTMETNVNVHVPNKLLCGMNGNSGSRQDYISSLFRLHHYRSGTWESFIERVADRRANMTIDRFMERNIKPRLIDDDIRPWINWFVEKVGMDEAKRLLVNPLAEAYTRFKDLPVHARISGVGL
jgi:hypothetical protein